MEFEGVVFRKLPEQSGTSARGEWKKQEVVFELPGEFSRKVCVTFFGERAEDAAALNEGDTVQVSANVESREYNGKWYTDVKAWKIAPKGAAPAGSDAPAAGSAGYGAGSGSYGAAAQKSDSQGAGGGSDAGASGGSGSSAPSALPMADAPFNEAFAPGDVAAAEEVDDLPF